MAKNTSEKAFKFIGLLMFWAGLAVFIYTVNFGIQTSAQSDWPTVDGTIIKAEFKEIANPEYVEGKEVKNQSKVIWVPDFLYSYQVNGRQYESSRVSTFDATCRNEGEVLDLRRLISHYNTIKVYYNPENPEFAVVNPFPSLVNVWITMISSIVCACSGLFLYWACRNL